MCTSSFQTLTWAPHKTSTFNTRACVLVLMIDRLRLYIVYFMNSDLSDEEAEKCENALKDAGCDIGMVVANL